MEEVPEAKDVLDAMAKNAVWEKQADGKWLFGQKALKPVFRLNPPAALEKGRRPVPDCDAMKRQILQDMPELGNGGRDGETALDQVLSVLANGFAIEESLSPTEVPDRTQPASCQFLNHLGASESRPQVPIHLVMRSLIGMLAAAAQEQVPFEKLKSLNPLIPAEPGKKEFHFTETVPLAEQIPLLRLRWEAEDTEMTPPLIQLTYRGKSYLVADVSAPPPSGPSENFFLNRDAFRLICQLTAQVTVDISKFPLPETLQLRTE